MAPEQHNSQEHIQTVAAGSRQQAVDVRTVLAFDILASCKNLNSVNDT